MKTRQRKLKDPAYKNLRSHIKKYEVNEYVTNNHDDEKKNDDNNQTSKPQVTCKVVNKLVPGSISLGKHGLKLRIKKQGWLYLHEEVLAKIVNFVHELFKNPNVQNCKKVIVVGGFANSEYLVHRLLMEFPDKQFLKPRQPHLAVVRGLLYWICQRRKLRKSRARYSYGIGIDRKFREGCDPEARRKMVPGLGAIVDNAFEALIIRNQEYEEGYTERFNYWIPGGAKQVDMTLYASEDPFCEYVFDEDGSLPIMDGRKCFEIKKYVIPINKVSEEKQRFELKIEYHQTGINFYYVDPSDELERRGVFVMDDEYKQNGTRTKTNQMGTGKGCKLIKVQEDIRPKAVVAVDIGTHGTSMGYIICDEEKEQQILIEKNWGKNGDGCSKIKTDILLSQNGKFVAFGDRVVETLRGLSQFMLNDICTIPRLWI